MPRADEVRDLVNFNYAARKHVDANNLGPSYIMSLGDHEGGALWTSDRGLIDCKGRWASFDGNTEHETKPYEGRERFSFILFTPDAYNRLPPDVCATARDLGLTAASTDGFDDAYFAQFRDLGVVDEREFDAYTDDHHVEHPPRLAPGTICVETNGYAAGRGWGWISWPTSDSTDDDDRRLEKLSNSGRLARFQKNQTGIHVVELQAKDGDDTEGLFFHLVDIHRFRLYQHTASESKRFADWVRALPDARVVACCITDTAMAKTRPLPGTVYDAFRQLGAPTDLTLIGYREPFCFVGWKNAPSAAAVYMLDAKKQSKQLLRIDATLQRALNLNLSPSPSPGGGLKLLAATKATFNLLDELDDRRNKKKKQRGGPANSTGPNADNRKRPKTGDQG
ncbi:hypothetical protein CTAYLR_000843 [Chrysophaeum taylorii]|uniref:ILEI/PANDER domain-containing protein n=1 Tax=Chrysophaeum taylorii TaxID=2483200 RepID=A0AAD7UR29_9STRA|nr:hypothetical protein CTAYLR_000843 [Chrysophaeum taylorii]